MSGPFNLANIPLGGAFQAADKQVAAIQTQTLLTQPKFLVTMYTNSYGVYGIIGDYLSCEVEFKRNQVGTGTIVVKGSDPLGQYAHLNCPVTVVPITVQVNGLRWSGRVSDCEYSDVEGIQTYTLQLKSDWDWFNHLLVWPNFLFPLELQFPTKAIFAGQSITNLKELIAEQTIRLQLGLWEWLDEIYDPAAWFASTQENEGLLVPIAVNPSNPLTDTSPWTAVVCQMDTVATIAEQILKSTGLVLTAELWLPGDPQPSGLTLNQPCIVVDVLDKSGVTGPTGTFIDGLITDIATLATGAYAEVVLPLNGSGYLPPGVVIDPALGVDWTPPWVVYYPDNRYSGVKELHITAHSPIAYTVLSGGKSPSWVNDLINVALEGLVSLILGAIATIPLLAGAAAAAGFVDTLVDGIFSNVVLAWDELENAPRRKALGPFGFPEFPTAIGSTAWTLDSAFSLLDGMWTTRGFWSMTLTTTQDYPYQFGRDFGIGDLVSYVHNNTMWSDYVYSVVATDTREDRWQSHAQIGDGQSTESPFAVLQRRMTAAAAALQVSLLSSN